MLTHGTRGDVEPFVALALELTSRGHDVVLFAPASSAPLVKSYDLEFVPVHDTWNALMHEPSIRSGFETNFKTVKTITAMRKFRRLARQVLDDMTAAVSYNPELVVCHASGPLHAIAERLRVPAVIVCPEPVWIPTRAFPNPLIPFRLPTPLNRLSYAATPLWIRGFIGKTTKWRRKTLGLPRRRHQNNSLRRPDGSHATVLQPFSRHILPDTSDYPDSVHTTGFWFLPTVSSWVPPKRLSDFIAAGDPPVYIGFGSMAGTDPKETGELIRQATSIAKVRAVVVSGSGGIDLEYESDQRVLSIDQAPFSWLFPRMAAIVHHGGSGTTGAALLAGRPQVVCPFMNTQHFYAERVHALGISPEPLPQDRLTAHHLAHRIHRAVNDVELERRAANMRSLIYTEHGTGRAVKIFESTLNKNAIQ
ncbi:glycosyltransferase [Phytoactinopolyspora halophila]|nr:glycosyltransferase [Phytoactinopolyspora halophila]